MGRERVSSAPGQPPDSPARDASVIVLDTPQGSARAHLHPADGPAAALILGHGAGGGVGTPDLLATANVACSLGISAALFEQPYLVAGRRSPAPAQQLDAAWMAAVAKLREEMLRGLPLMLGGRSAGARAPCCALPSRCTPLAGAVTRHEAVSRSSTRCAFRRWWFKGSATPSECRRRDRTAWWRACRATMRSGAQPRSRQR